MLKDRGDLLKYALAGALKRAAKIVRGLRAGLTVSEREAVAEQAVTEIRNLPNDPWKLNERLQHAGASILISALRRLTIGTNRNSVIAGDATCPKI